MSEHEEEFKQLAESSGVPTSETEINARFNAIKVSEGLSVTNNSPFGAFWRFVDAMATKAAKWLIDFIIQSVLPQAFAKLATGVYLDMHAWAVNLERKEATKARGNIEFSRLDSAGELEVPAEVKIQSQQINGQIYTLVTTESATFTDGLSSILIPVEASAEGSAHNLDEGYFTVLPAPVTGINAVQNNSDWLLAPGSDKETDEALRPRIKNQYDAVNQWHTDAVYRAIITEFDGLGTGNVYFEHGAPRGPGTANAYILLDTGTPSQAFLDSIQSKITDEENHGHGDDLAVLEIPETLHDIVCTVWPTNGLEVAETATLLSEVEQFIRCAFRENLAYQPTRTFPLELFSFSLLAQEIHANFNQVKNVSFDLQVIDVGLNIPRINNLTISEAP